MLELAADRYLAHLGELQSINSNDKPIDRMIVVIRWFLAAFAELEVRFYKHMGTRPTSVSLLPLFGAAIFLRSVGRPTLPLRQVVSFLS